MGMTIIKLPWTWYLTNAKYPILPGVGAGMLHFEHLNSSGEDFYDLRFYALRHDSLYKLDSYQLFDWVDSNPQFRYGL
jgi:hypothetical protein